eukprot:CAMPEP_0115066190 /NCGR_PEP_ID=MMETSP0227-20121206/10675_1 /TAXON_ID=89957 /ORGANISM="Polarella glacialis, Strain CCMP 1383" /LENGTH=90 /DNA_ID=CAMNT_0002452075 /DNA_START=379 /DNA_END=651 /DNA_ORIENTATION=+
MDLAISHHAAAYTSSGHQRSAVGPSPAGKDLWLFEGFAELQLDALVVDIEVRAAREEVGIVALQGLCDFPQAELVLVRRLGVTISLITTH